MAMSRPAEVVFPLDLSSISDATTASGLFSYANGQVKVPGPWKRGRPKGSKTKKYNKNQRSWAKQAFEFVNTSATVNAIDVATRARIRRHAKLHGSSADRSAEKADEDLATCQMVAAAPNLRQVWAVDPFGQFPFKLEPYMYDLLWCISNTIWKIFYSLEQQVGYNPIKSYWLPLALNDAALLHSFIGCAGIFTGAYRSSQDTRGLKHLQASISIVQQRLTSQETLIESVVVPVVAGVALLERAAGRQENWKVHMNGLRHLVSHFGGVEYFFAKPVLLQKIYRADLYGSLNAEQRPYFSGPRLASLLEGTGFSSPGFKEIDQNFPIGITLQACIASLEELNISWFSKTHLSTADATKARHTLTSIQYALASLEPRQGDNIDAKAFELLRIALILYMWTIINEHASSTTVIEELCLKFWNTFDEAIIRPLGHFQRGEGELALLDQSFLPFDFYLWAFFLGASIVISKKICVGDQILDSFARLASARFLEIRDWHDLKNRLGQYLWVPSIHDGSSRALWAQISATR